jgi:hypothetical protein
MLFLKSAINVLLIVSESENVAALATFVLKKTNSVHRIKSSERQIASDSNK